MPAPLAPGTWSGRFANFAAARRGGFAESSRPRKRRSTLDKTLAL